MNIIEPVRRIKEKILSLADRILDWIPAGKSRVLILVLGGLVLLAICLTLISIIVHVKKPDTTTVSASAGIPVDELFYPDEPDFLPDLLVDKPNNNWTADDIRPYWQDPGLNNETQWREIAGNAIDKLMEGVK
ncbi:MAG: hypothetical protein FWD78_09715 [Treponema sp.]|nr:hypothetical protein [Treponema sp.]